MTVRHDFVPVKSVIGGASDVYCGSEEACPTGYRRHLGCCLLLCLPTCIRRQGLIVTAARNEGTRKIGDWGQDDMGTSSIYEHQLST